VRLAIFGGSFDPPHIGHLLVALDAAEQLALDRVVFVPAATQPLKAGRAVASAEQRVAMVRELVAGEPVLELSTVEVDRSGLSFTVDTLAHFAERQPQDTRFLLLGDDVLASFGQWKEPKRILGLAQVVLLEREGQRSTLPPVMEGADVQRLRTRRVDVSSTEIRDRIRTGKSVRGMVTDGVAEYIGRAGLYR
jgi:nicotinate-nucleotide adenylyltransferase